MTYSQGLSYYRFVVSFLVIKNTIFYFPMASELFGKNAIIPLMIYDANNSSLFYLKTLLFFPFQYSYSAQLFLILTFITATIYLFGKWRFVSGWILYYFIMVAKERNGFILDGSDNVIQVTLPFLILAETLQPQLVAKVLFLDKIKNFTNFDLFLLALKVQVCFVYFFTSLAKLQGTLWLNGTAVYYTMRVSEFNATSWNVPLTENHYFVVASTYFTILFEIAFPFLIWFKRPKFFIIIAGIFLHVGIWVFMRIDNFSWIMIGTYFLFIADNEYNQFQAIVYKKRLLIYFDSWCPKCRAFISLIRMIDVFENVQYASIRDIKTSDIIDTKRSLREMPSIQTNNDKVYYGFDSLLNVTKAIPILWLFVPLMYVLKITNLGKILYKEIADNRKTLHCNEDECSL